MGAREESTPAAITALAATMVTRFVVDDALTIHFAAAGREVRLRIDAAGRLERAGEVTPFTPDENPASLAPVLALLHERVRGAAIGPDGSLTVDFAGARLVALADPHAVSWSANESGGASATCIAEGRVVWS